MFVVVMVVMVVVVMVVVLGCGEDGDGLLLW